MGWEGSDGLCTQRIPKLGIVRHHRHVLSSHECHLCFHGDDSKHPGKRTGQAGWQHVGRCHSSCCCSCNNHQGCSEHPWRVHNDSVHCLALTVVSGDLIS